MASLSGPVLVKGAVLNSVKSGEGRVIRVILPPGASLTNESIQATVWKTQLKEFGFAKCGHDRCSLAFLSVKGVEAHVKTCRGFSVPGDFVVCPACQERFKTFSTMAKHHLKAHGSVPMSAPSVDDAIKSNFDSDVETNPTPSRLALPDDVDDEAELDDESTLESRDKLRIRILEESRLISTARPRGRPRKSEDGHRDKESHPRGLQYQDPFDIEESGVGDKAVQCVQVQPMTDAFKKAVDPGASVVRRRLATSRLSVTDQQEYVQMKTLDGQIVWVPKSSIPASFYPENLAEKAAKLADYQDIVMEYEHLAEEATKMAMAERTNQLISYEKELKRREMEAKRKLAGAVQVLQKIEIQKKHFYEAGSVAETGSVVVVESDVRPPQVVVASDKSSAAETLDLEILLPDLNEIVEVEAVEASPTFFEGSNVVADGSHLAVEIVDVGRKDANNISDSQPSPKCDEPNMEGVIVSSQPIENVVDISSQVDGSEQNVNFTLYFYDTDEKSFESNG